MTDDGDSDNVPDREGESGRQRRHWWWQRMSVRQIRRQAEAARLFHQELDARYNRESRLPDGERVELGGLVLAEVFTPSTVGRLLETLEQRQAANPYDSGDRAAHVRRSRTSPGGGWSNLGMVRRPGNRMVPNFGVMDPKLPKGVDAAFLSVSTVTASVAVVTATFALEPGFLDLGTHLATDRRLTVSDVKIVIPGRFGKLRSRIPWSRPKSHGTSSAMNDVWRLKEQAIEDAVRNIEDRCAEWFYDQFPGRFSKISRGRRPHVRIIFTEQGQPFESTKSRTPFGAAGIGVSWQVYQGSETRNAGWRLGTGAPFRSEHDPIWTFAALRSDVAHEMTRGEPDGSNWAVVQRFHDEQGPLVALRALQVMLQTYANDLAEMRDRPDRARRFNRTVREAQTMNAYLLTTGLDVSSVTSDISTLTKNLERFRWSVPEYHEELRRSEGAGDQLDELRSLVPLMRDMIRWQAKQLSRASTDTDQNLRASAELQQAIANTRMQRIVLALTVVAVVVAVIALLAGGDSP